MVDRVDLSGNFFAKLGALGVPVGEVCRRAGLPSRSEELVVTTGQMFSLWRVIAEVSPDPAIGLKMGREFRSGSHDPLSIVAYSAPTFHEALQKVARYKRLRGAEDMRVVERGALVRVEVDWMYGSGEPGLLLDSAMASLVEIGVRGTGRNLRPEHVELRRANDGLNTYEKYFGCPVHYGSSQDALVFAAWQTALVMITRNAALVGLIEPKLEADLAERLGDRWSDRVRAVLRRELAGSRPALDDIASRLNQSPRTLQRRLTEEGTAFQTLLDEVRMDLARRYLSDSSLTLGQISYLVGFDEPHSFHRSFRALGGMAPSEWREYSHKGGAVPVQAVPPAVSV